MENASAVFGSDKYPCIQNISFLDEHSNVNCPQADMIGNKRLGYMVKWFNCLWLVIPTMFTSMVQQALAQFHLYLKRERLLVGFFFY